MSALKGEKIDQKICVLCPNGLSFVVAQWATWMTGNIFVPLSKNHSVSALEYFVKDSKASLIIGTEASSEKLNELSKKADVPLLMLDKTWTSKPITEFEDPIDCDIFDMLYSMGTVIGRETTRSKERPEGSTWKSSLYWTLMMLQGPGD